MVCPAVERKGVHPNMLDLDVEIKLRLVGMGHLIRKVRELGRELDPTTMKLLDYLVATKADLTRPFEGDDPPPRVRSSSCDKYYAILELPVTASRDEIKLQYRRLALKHHPDLGGDLERMQQITEAYNTLMVQHS